MAKGRIPFRAGIGCLIVLAILLPARDANAPKIPALPVQEGQNGFWAVSIDPDETRYFNNYTLESLVGFYPDGTFLTVIQEEYESQEERLFRFGREGNVIRQTHVRSPGKYNVFRQLCVLPEGGYAAAGRSIPNDRTNYGASSWIARFRKDDSLVWSHFFAPSTGFPEDIYFDSIIALSEGGFMATGHTSFQYKKLIVRLNEEGIILGQRLIELDNVSPLIKICPDGRGGVWGITTESQEDHNLGICLLKINPDLTVSFANRFKIRDIPLEMPRITSKADGGVVVAARYRDPGTWRAPCVALAFDSQARLEKAVEIDVYDYFNPIAEKISVFPDGGLLLTREGEIIRLNPGWETGWVRNLVSLLNPPPQADTRRYQNLSAAVPAPDGDGLLLLGFFAGQPIFARTDVAGGSCGLLDNKVEVKTQSADILAVPSGVQTKTVSLPEVPGTLETESTPPRTQDICPSSTSFLLRFGLKGFSPSDSFATTPTEPAAGEYSVPSGLILKIRASICSAMNWSDGRETLLPGRRTRRMLSASRWTDLGR